MLQMIADARNDGLGWEFHSLRTLYQEILATYRIFSYISLNVYLVFMLYFV